MSTNDSERRVLSGMRPSGRLHIGNYHGVLKNWVRLQHEYDCFFFVADWHALTTEYNNTKNLEKFMTEMVIDWLASGLNPQACTMFVQSKVPEHAELHLLLAMLTPLSWLERVPSYKEQISRLQNRKLDTFGFLGYPLLQSADILIYRAGNVPVGQDQVAHIELTREIARRFNYAYGREEQFEIAAEQSIEKLPKKTSNMIRSLRKKYIENGDTEALERAKALLAGQQNLSIGDIERIYGYIEGVGRIVLPEPKVLTNESSRITGLDGEKMSKAYNNVIQLREPADSITKKIQSMQTDPARVRRQDPGDPDKCPVFSLHQVYTDSDIRQWVVDGCRNAKIGCIDCKKPLIDAVNHEQEGFRQRAEPFEENPSLVRSILLEGSEKARDIAKETMEDVRSAVGISYR